MTLLGLIILLVLIGTTIWVGVDASKRDWGSGGAAAWVIGCVLLWIVVFPVYLVTRGRRPLKEAATGPAGVPRSEARYRECPHCKEAMRRDAEVCPHCRLRSTPWLFHEGRWWFRASEEDAWQWLDERTGNWVAHEPVGVPADRSPASAAPKP